MKPLIYLDKINDDIAEEAINFSIFTKDNTQPKDDLISELQELTEVGKKNQNKMTVEYDELKRKYSTMSRNYEEYKKNSKT